MSPIVGKRQQPSGGIRLDGSRPNVPVKFEKVISSDVILPPLLMRSASDTAYVSPTKQKGIRMTAMRKRDRIKRIIAAPNTVPRKEGLRWQLESLGSHAIRCNRLGDYIFAIGCPYFDNAR